MGVLKIFVRDGPPPGFTIPSGVTGPPPGFTPPPGMTGPPAWLFQGSTPTSTAASAALETVGSSSVPSPTMPIPVGFPSTLPSSIPSNIANAIGQGKHPPIEMSQHGYDVMVGVTSMLLVLVLGVLAGRLLSRRMSKQVLGPDDYTAIGAALLFVGLATEQYLLAKYGTGSGIPTPETFQHLGRLEFASQLTYTFLTTTAKFSILLLYKRVFNMRTRWFRIAWWTCLILCSLFLIVLFCLTLTQCAPHPPSAMWNDLGACPFNKNSSMAMGYVNAILDLAVLILPIKMTWDLQMSYQQKIAISSVFGLGILGFAVSLARAITLSSTNVFTQGLLTFAIWSTTEPAVAIICACLPVMRPFFISIIKFIPSTGRSWTSWSNSWGRKYRRTGSSAGSASDGGVASDASKTLTNNSLTSNKHQSFPVSEKGSAAGNMSSPFTRSMSPRVEAREIPHYAFPAPPPANTPESPLESNLRDATGKRKLNIHIGNLAKVARYAGQPVQDGVPGTPPPPPPPHKSPIFSHGSVGTRQDDGFTRENLDDETEDRFYMKYHKDIKEVCR